MTVRSWFYFAQEDIVDDAPTQTTWHGRGELLRWSSVVLRQRRFTLGPIRFFYGKTQVDLELIWRWHDEELALANRSELGSPLAP